MPIESERQHDERMRREGRGRYRRDRGLGDDLAEFVRNNAAYLTGLAEGRDTNELRAAAIDVLRWCDDMGYGRTYAATRLRAALGEATDGA